VFHVRCWMFAAVDASASVCIGCVPVDRVAGAYTRLICIRPCLSACHLAASLLSVVAYLLWPHDQEASHTCLGAKQGLSVRGCLATSFVLPACRQHLGGMWCGCSTHERSCHSRRVQHMNTALTPDQTSGMTRQSLRHHNSHFILHPVL
jgi:hypothetical protein